MDDKYATDKITPDEIKSSVSYLNDNVSKDAKPLNEMRLHAIPETVRLRKEDGDAFLEKTELLVLTEWRAHRAKAYSSKQGELTSANSAQDVRKITRKAFSEYESSDGKINNALKTLQTLESVPFQMATLILSVYDPERVPYFLG